MNTQPTALLLAGFWAAKNDQGEYLYSSLRFREETAAELRRLHEIEKQYNELLYAVGNKYEDESRYQTTLRYIQQAEAYNSTAIAKVEGPE